MCLRREPVLQPPHHELLEHDAQARHLFQRPRRQAGDPYAAPGQPDDQAFLHQPRESLAQRDVTDAELAGQAALDQVIAGRVDTLRDRGAQALRDGICQALIRQRIGDVHAA